MNENNHGGNKEITLKRLVISAAFSAMITTAIASFYPAGRPIDEVTSLTFAESYGWVFSQSLLLASIACACGVMSALFSPRFGLILGSGLILSLPWIYLADVLAFTWIGERFLSATMAHIVKSLLPALSLHVTQGAMIQASFSLLIAMLFTVVVFSIAKLIANRWENSKDSITAFTGFMVLFGLAVVFSVHPMLKWTVIRRDMELASSRHPFCAFHLVGFRGVGLSARDDSASPESRLRALSTFTALQKREGEMLGIEVSDANQKNVGSEKFPQKVIVVVVECLRPEAISPELMPNLFAFSKRSILLRQHFSGGNSTCLGMFSLLTGLESIWFHRKVNEQPIFNKILRQAGFQLAFFGGQTDWRVYDMDGFVNDRQYDHFIIEDPDLPQTDLNAVQRTLSFINTSTPDQGKGGESQNRVPSLALDSDCRAAICYLYGTHSSFRYSDPDYQVFLPEAEEGLLISNSPELKDQFYNRYKNSLRSMDDILTPLLRDDCLVIITGDHGEPFLDDGTASHGTRLSKYQNMTPAVIYYPGVEPEVRESPTFHGDLLPTLLAGLGISVKQPDVFDGVDLTSVDDNYLNQRLFVTGNFMDATSLLVGPWTLDKNLPFGYRVVHDIYRWQAGYLNPVDSLGYETNTSFEDGSKYYKKWFRQRFRETFPEEASEMIMFRQCLRSGYAEVRLAALSIAATVDQPSDELIRLIQERISDEDEEVRKQAKEITIKISREQDWLSLFN